MENDQQHLVNIEKVEYHYHNHIDIAEILSNIHIIKLKLHTMAGTLADIQAQNTALIAAVTAEDTIIDSAVTLISGFGATLQSLKDQLADAIAHGLDPAAAQAVVDSMGSTISDINAKKQALADAVTANTPAE